MRTMLALALVMIGAGAAAAQPGMTEPQPPPPPGPAPYGPPPAGYAPMPYAYQPPVQLTQEERDLLAEGEISDGQLIGGGAMALFVGLGVGQAVQGRWHDTGWIFTLGEPVAMTIMMVGVAEAFAGDCVAGGPCHNNNNGAGALIIGGMLGFVGLHVWEVVDAFAAPPRHNARVRALRARLGYAPPMYSHVVPYVAPTHGGDGGVAGVGFRF